VFSQFVDVLSGGKSPQPSLKKRELKTPAPFKGLLANNESLEGVPTIGPRLR
jgi:hypothetical protein